MTTYTNVASGGAVCGGRAFLPDPIVVDGDSQQLDVTLFKYFFRSQRVPPVTFRVYQEGRLIKTIQSKTGSASTQLTIGVDENPYVEVLDEPTLIPHPAFTGDLLLTWRQVASASSYQVQQSNDGGSTWTTLITIPDNPTQENYQFETGWLQDVTVYDFQIVPLDASGEPGTPFGFNVEQNRHPDIPKVTYTYNPSTQKITIS